MFNKIFLAIFIFWTIGLNTTLAETASRVDVLIKELTLIETTTAEGLPQVEIIAFINNNSTTPVQNCAVTLTVNNTAQTPKTYTSLEKGYNYLFQQTLNVATPDAAQKIQLSACPNASGESSPKNNTKENTINTSQKTNTAGTKVDLTITDYRTLLVKDETNANRYWFMIKYANQGENSTNGTIGLKHMVNGIELELLDRLALPGNSTGLYSNFYSESLSEQARTASFYTSFYGKSPFMEGKNIVTLTIDPSQGQPEIDEKDNTLVNQITQSDGLIKKIKKLSTSPKLIVEGLLITNQNQTNITQPQSPNGLMLSVPILNVYQDFTVSSPTSIKITLTKGETAYEQTYQITDWKKGALQTFYFTNKFFKKKTLKGSFKMTMSLETETVFNESMKPSSFY